MKCKNCKSIIHLNNEQTEILRKMMLLSINLSATGINNNYNMLSVMDKNSKCCKEPNYHYIRGT